jgi:hypothetical protein
MTPSEGKMLAFFVDAGLPEAGRADAVTLFGEGVVRRAVNHGLFGSRRYGEGTNRKIIAVSDKGYRAYGRRPPTPSSGRQTGVSITLNRLRARGEEILSARQASERFEADLPQGRHYSVHEGRVSAVIVPGALTPVPSMFRSVLDFHAEALARPAVARLIEEGLVRVTLVVNAAHKCKELMAMFARAKSDERRVAVNQLDPRVIVIKGFGL